MSKQFLYWDEPDNLSGSKKAELLGKILARHRSESPVLGGYLKKPKVNGKPK